MGLCPIPRRGVFDSPDPSGTAVVPALPWDVM